MGADIIIPGAGMNPFTRSSTMYFLNRDKLRSVCDELFTQTFLSRFVHLWDMPVDAITSVYLYPINFRTLLPEALPFQINIAGVPLATEGYFWTYSLEKYLMGSYVFTPHFNNFLDYSPYTSIDVYLPYIGWERLDPEQVFGKTINFWYTVDYTSGGCTCYLVAGSGVDAELIMIREGKLGLQIPLAGGNASEIARNLLFTGVTTTAGMIGGLAVGGTVGGIAGGLIAGAGNAVNAAQPRVKGSTTLTFANGIYGPQNVIIKFTRPIVRKPTSYNHDVGMISGKTEQLRQLSGFTVVDKVHVEGSGFASASYDEIAEIERLLHEGIIL